MKKTFVFILLIAFMLCMNSGCAEDQAQIQQIQEQFLALTKEPATEKGIKDTEKFLNANLSKLDKESASHLIVSYENYISNCSEYGGIDYEAFAKKYKPYIIEPLTQLYEMRADMQKKPLEIDALLQYSWPQIGDKALEIEAFIDKNKQNDEVRRVIGQDAAWNYKNILYTLIAGTNRNPVFQADSGQFDQEAIAAYKKIIDKHPNTTTAWALTEYLNYIDSINGTFDHNDKVQSKAYLDTCTWITSEAGKRVFQ